MELSIVRILSDQFAAWHYDAKVQSGLESSYQAYEYVKSVSYTHLTLPTKRIV